MASVKISDLEAILKEFYLGPIIEALNSQLEMVDLFKKITVDWSGKKVIIPVHVSRNTGTGYRREGNQIPAAGGQGDRKQLCNLRPNGNGRPCHRR